LQVPFIFGGHFLHPQHENTLCCGDRTHYAVVTEHTMLWWQNTLCCGDRTPLFTAILHGKRKIQRTVMTHF